MKYQLDKNLSLLKKDASPTKDGILIEIITSKEYKEQYESKIHQKILSKNIHGTDYCKADILPNCVIGTFAIPNKTDISGDKIIFDYYLTTNRLVFIDDTEHLQTMINHMIEVHIVEQTFVGHFLFELMEYVIKDDIIFLQKYEEGLEGIEEQLLDESSMDFNKNILVIRKELSILSAYYQQLMDVSEILEENANHLFTEEDCRLFGLYLNRVTRLHENIKVLKEYSMQLREIYQSQIDIRQNNIMRFLTVVTTIFMPLTLIAGWYGMNFKYMPELGAPYGYVIIIVISAIITIVEIWYFKVRKWFD